MTNSTNFHTFRLEGRSSEQLAMIGIDLRAPRLPKTYTVSKGRTWVEIGWVFVHAHNGRIALEPCKGLTERQMWFLIGAAEDAFRNPPSESTGWARKSPDAEWWEGGILITCDPDEAAASLVAAAERVITTSLALDLDSPIDLVPTEPAWGIF